MRTTAIGMCLLCLAPVAAAAPPTMPAAVPVEPVTVTLPVPWTPGTSLTYATELVDVRVGGGKDRRIVANDTTTIAMDKAEDGSWRQSWTSRDPGVTVLLGDDPDTVEGMKAAARAFEDYPLQVRLGPDAGYAGIENLAEISSRLRDAMRPLMIAGVDRGISESLGDDADQAARATATAAAMERMEQVLDAMTSPAVVEAMLRRTPENFNAFTGMEVELGATYAAESELDNPLGTTVLPARLEFFVYRPEEQPGHLLLEWTSTIDPERGADVAWETVQTMLGIELPADSRKGLPTQLTLGDSGFFLIDEAGIPEMVETERTVAFGDMRTGERQRMRLVGGHDHEWAQDDAATWFPVEPEQPPVATGATPAD